ncbi:hypothetical protein [Actinokineospora terrae]|uniref:Membrane domain of glycerophosphoryl diester phosphodiesterase n=1 Tax=Actinokineospora terrae TaxID=155974 RepID=A0A1H9Q871_9PSEU|nr:hypothetical protein [Actinokineospora terrae]SER56053.1 hypothetical protein SAMN04487818_104103 [Actinokineospora terrae]
MTDRPDQPEQPSGPEPTPPPVHPSRSRTDHTGAIQLGIVPLRPLSLPDFVGGTVSALRRNAGALLGVSLAVALGAELLRLLLSTLFIGDIPTAAVVTGTAIDWDVAGRILGDLAIGLAATAVLGLVLAAAVNIVIPRAVFGHATGVRQALRESVPHLGRLLATTLIMVVILGGLGSIAVLAMVAAGGAGILIALPLLVGIIYLSIAFTFARSLVVVEGLGPAAALDRSRHLVRAGGWWRVAGITTLLNVVLGIFGLVITTLFDRVSNSSSLGGTLAIILAGSLTGVVVIIFECLLYIDYRARTEGIEGLWLKAG